VGFCTRPNTASYGEATSVVRDGAQYDGLSTTSERHSMASFSVLEVKKTRRVKPKSESWQCEVAATPVQTICKGADFGSETLHSHQLAWECKSRKMQSFFRFSHHNRWPLSASATSFSNINTPLASNRTFPLRLSPPPAYAFPNARFRPTQPHTTLSCLPEREPHRIRTLRSLSSAHRHRR